jgi:hypothetical protein
MPKFKKGDMVQLPQDGNRMVQIEEVHGDLPSGQIMYWVRLEGGLCVYVYEKDMASTTPKLRNQFSLGLKSPLEHKMDVAKRRMDALGIDYDPRATPHNKEVQILRSGNKDGGTYVSQPGLDPYGEFRWMGPKMVAKYEQKECARLIFQGPPQLEALRLGYQKEPTTGFLKALMLDQQITDRTRYEGNKSRFAYFDNHTYRQNPFFVYPNLPYTTEKDHVSASKTWRDRKSGVTLCAWPIHIDLPAPFLKKFGRSNFNKPEALWDLPQKDLGKLPGNECLTSILDLEAKHLRLLQCLKSDMLHHLRTVYDVDQEKDHVKLFFHFPPGLATATLHLHAWVNKADHPLSEGRSIYLDEIIGALASKRTVADIILIDRKGSFDVPLTADTLEIDGIPEPKTIANTRKLGF